VEVIEERLDEREMLIWVQPGRPFEFIRSQTAVFDTHGVFRSPEALASHIPALSISRIFYCAIAARRRVERRVDDFSVWLSVFGGAYQLPCRKTGRRRCTGASAPIPRSRRRCKLRVSTALRIRWA